MTDRTTPTDTDHIPDVRKMVSDHIEGEDLDTAQLRELGEAAFDEFCAEYELQGLVNTSEEAGFKTGYGFASNKLAATIATQQARIDELEASYEALGEWNQRYWVALDKLSRLGNGNAVGNSNGNMIARAALKAKP